MKEKYYFKLNCPNCNNNQLYHTQSQILTDKRKTCVYCGKSFKVKDRIL